MGAGQEDGGLAMNERTRHGLICYWFGLPIWCMWDEKHMLKYQISRYGSEYKIVKWEVCPWDQKISFSTAKTPS